ncbi:MAG: phenylalanine--tRNA ligase subunit beta [Gemmatimonadales bacterium]|nr:MAG: phenylalanine--tRNA ligase subunit beta [Gemmatimonadales bacterium]
MNVSFRWIRDLAPELEIDPGEAATRLTARGFPVEDRLDLSRGLREIRIARVEAVRSHPNADRLRLCDVDDGTEVVQVVCGAENVEAGAWYPFAPVGATLPGGMTIRKAKLRGEVSMGMLCSEAELGLGPGSDGLLTLHGSFSAGDSFVDATGLDDYRLDVEVTSNRPDLLSHRGIARELLREGDGEIRLPMIPGESEAARIRVEELEHRQGDGSGVRSERASIRIDDAVRCPRYLGLVIRGVTVGPSPEWLQARLRAVGARPINNVVDATNYVLQELGQPLHAFDLDRLDGGSIVVRRAREGERIRTLDGVERTLTSEMLAICDAERPIAIAGVMGGEESEVTTETRDVFLECALFAPGPIRATRKALGLSTDASYRFERGADPAGLTEALTRCARVIQAVAGGEVEGPVLDEAEHRYHPPRVTLRPERVQRVLGVEFEESRIRSLLDPLGFTVESSTGTALSVGIPGWRSWDVTREVDLIEEIARTHGYDRFPDTLGAYRPGTVPDDPSFAVEDRIRAELAAWGLHEAQTPAFAPEGEGKVEVLNPISTEERWLRRSLLPALLRRVEYNLARGNRDVRLYEIGTTFRPGEEGFPPIERTHLAFVLHGRRAPEHWSEPDEALDFWDVKGLLEAITDVVHPGELRLGAASTDAADAGPFVPGAHLAIFDAAGSPRGNGGAIDPARVDLPPWAGTVWGLELEIPAADRAPESETVRPLPSHPGTDRDLALVVRDEQPLRDVMAHLEGGGGEYLRTARVFDLYRGEGIPEGSRSIAVRLHFRADDRTLTDHEVDGVIATLSRTLKEELGVGIRGE